MFIGMFCLVSNYDGHNKGSVVYSCGQAQPSRQDITAPWQRVNGIYHCPQPWSATRQWAKLWRSGRCCVKACYYHQIRHHVDNDCLCSLIHAFITSRLDYCNSLYARCNASVLQRLQRVQNCAARYILNAPPRSPSPPLLHHLHWLPIESRICYKLAAWCTESTTTLLLRTYPNCVFPVVTLVFDLACLLVVVGRFRPRRCTAGVSVARSTMAAKMTAETEVWSTDSATLGTCRPGWSCLRSCMSTSSAIAGYLLRGCWEIIQSSSTCRSPWFSVSCKVIKVGFRNVAFPEHRLNVIRVAQLRPPNWPLSR